MSTLSEKRLHELATLEEKLYFKLSELNTDLDYLIKANYSHNSQYKARLKIEQCKRILNKIVAIAKEL